MKTRIITAAVAATVAIGAVPAVAAARPSTATGPYVEHALVAHWRTPDSVNVASANCWPNGALFVRQDRIFSNHWRCIEVDRESRVLWVEVRVIPGRRYGGIVPRETRCNAKASNYACP